jgi:hypothetical protein
MLRRVASNDIPSAGGKSVQGDVSMVRRTTFGLVAGIGVAISGFGLTGAGKLSLRPHPLAVRAVTGSYRAPSYPFALAFPNGTPIGCPARPLVQTMAPPHTGLPITRVARLRVLGSCD